MMIAAQASQSRPTSCRVTGSPPKPIVKQEPADAAPIKREAGTPIKVPSPRKGHKSPIYISSDEDDSDAEVGAVIDAADLPAESVRDADEEMESDGDKGDESGGIDGDEEMESDEDKGDKDEGIHAVEGSREQENEEHENEEHDELQADQLAAELPEQGQHDQVRPRTPTLSTTHLSSSSSSPPSPTSVRFSVPGPSGPKARPKARSTSKASVGQRALPAHLAFLSQPLPGTSRPRQRSVRAASQRIATPDSSDEDVKRRIKRARISENTEQQTRQQLRSMRANMLRIRHEEFWLLDGSVVVQVHNTLFRLHRSRLVQHSKYFEQLFRSRRVEMTADEDGTSEPELIDDCPVYKVTNVSVLDFESLLISLDKAMEYVFQPPPFPELAAILRAAQALKFAVPFEFAARILREMWPPVLSKLTSASISHASETIVLAKTCSMPELLKRAYYELLRTGGLGQEEEDSDSEDEKTNTGSRRHTRIARSDLVLLIKAREHLALEWFFAASSPPSAEIFPCPLDVKNIQAAITDPRADAGKLSTDGETRQPRVEGTEDLSTSSKIMNERCAQARAANRTHWDKRVRQSGLYEDSMYDPLCGLQKMIEMDWQREGYCDGCVKAWKDAWALKREKIWSNLDIWLELAEPQD